MPAEIVNGEYCASWFATYEIPASNPKPGGDTLYLVTINGGEGPAFCTCPAFKYFKGDAYDRTCKHIEQVHQEACLWNCQWHDGNDPVLLKPVSIERSARQEPLPKEDCCKNCGGPLVTVRIAV